MNEPSKTCTNCGERKSVTEFRWGQCRDCERAAGRTRAAARRAADPEASRARVRSEYQQRRAKVFDHYGWACACCGSTEKPSIDHVNNDGAQHREELFGNKRHGSGSRFYLWLTRNGFPDGYQTLCMSCNHSKAYGGVCRLMH